jgi:hypothetical protein
MGLNWKAQKYHSYEHIYYKSFSHLFLLFSPNRNAALYIAGYKIATWIENIAWFPKNREFEILKRGLVQFEKHNIR